MRTALCWVLLAMAVMAASVVLSGHRVAAAAVSHVGAAGAGAGLGADAAAMAETEALTSASSLSSAQSSTETETDADAEGGAASGFDPHTAHTFASRGPCCRLCPNIFYAVPRVTPRPKPSGPPPLTAMQKRTARFAAVFNRAEPKTYDSDFFSFIAFAEQHSHSHSHSQSSRTPNGKMDRYRGQQDYPAWPEHAYTDDPYQDQPIPEFTPYASLPGINCCNICPAPGVGQLKWPDFLKWGEKPAVDDYPEPRWELPCCKLCSAGCYSNGEKRPPGVPDLSAAEAPTKLPSVGSFVERNAAVRNGQPISLAETSASAGRKPRAIQMRGNWPKQMDPPGANKPLVPKEKSCTPMLGCCQVCYNHPFIYDHAPEGIY